MEPQPGVLRRRGRGRRPAVRALARLPRVREHRRSRRGRPSHRYGNPAAAAVQPPALHAQSLEEYGLLGPGHVRGLLPPAVGLDSRVRGVRRGGVALRGLPLVKLVAFFALAVFVHGPLSPFLPTAFEATLVYYARFYPPWLLALVGTAGASLAEAVNYRLVDWAAELPKLAALRTGDRKSTRLNSSHLVISYAVFCLKKKKNNDNETDGFPRNRKPPRLVEHVLPATLIAHRRLHDV